MEAFGQIESVFIILKASIHENKEKRARPWVPTFLS